MSELKLTPEQRSLLAPYERHLFTASKAGYVVGLPAKVTQGVLWPVYTALYGRPPGHHTCNYCILQVCKRLAALYFAEPEAEANPDNKQPREGTKQPVSRAQTSDGDKLPTPTEKTREKAKKQPKKKQTKK